MQNYEKETFSLKDSTRIESTFDSIPLANGSVRLQQQIRFILEIDKLKLIMRRTSLLDQSRTENGAEHSWHLALMALIFSEYADSDVDIHRVTRMLLIHDLVEIDAGDTFLYDESEFAETQLERENVAAERIYGLLPSEMGLEFMSLWKEFEERKTPDAKFARSLDRLQPIFQNYFTCGSAWKKYGITANRVLNKNRVIGEGSSVLWELAKTLIKDAVSQGFLKENDTDIPNTPDACKDRGSK